MGTICYLTDKAEQLGHKNTIYFYIELMLRGWYSILLSIHHIRGMIGVGQAFSEKLTKEWPDMEIVHHFLPKAPRDRSKKF